MAGWHTKRDRAAPQSGAYSRCQRERSGSSGSYSVIATHRTRHANSAHRPLLRPHQILQIWRGMNEAGADSICLHSRAKGVGLLNGTCAACIISPRAARHIADNSVPIALSAQFLPCSSNEYALQAPPHRAHPILLLYWESPRHQRQSYSGF